MGDRPVNWLERQRREARLNAFLVGTYFGVMAALALGAAMGFLIDRYQEREVARMNSAISAEQMREMVECKRLVEKIGGSPYDETKRMADFLESRR